MNTNPAVGTLTARAVMAAGPVIPVVTLRDPGIAADLARSLGAGGIRVIEVTLRTPAALDCIRRISVECPETIVGAGTVCNAIDADAALAAGARFAVSPGYTASLGAACRRNGLPLLPGAVTASEIMSALDDGLDALKFFPAMTSGGVSALRALAGPFPQVLFCPTGGVNLANAPEFLALDNVACVGGSWMVPADALEQRDFGRIETLARAVAALALDAS